MSHRPHKDAVERRLDRLEDVLRGILQVLRAQGHELHELEEEIEEIEEALKPHHYPATTKISVRQV